MVSRRIAGEIIIVPIRSNVGDLDFIYTLNEAGSLIWESIDGHTSLGQIVAALCQRYDISQEAAETDVLEFIEALEGAGLVTGNHPSAPGKELNAGR